MADRNLLVGKVELLGALQHLDASSLSLYRVERWPSDPVDLKAFWGSIAHYWKFWYVMRHGWEDLVEGAARLLEVCAGYVEEAEGAACRKYALHLRNRWPSPTGSGEVVDLFFNSVGYKDRSILAVHASFLATRLLPSSPPGIHEALDSAFPLHQIRTPMEGPRE